MDDIGEEKVELVFVVVDHQQAGDLAFGENQVGIGLGENLKFPSHWVVKLARGLLSNWHTLGSGCSTAVERTPRGRDVMGSIRAGLFFSFYPQ